MGIDLCLKTKSINPELRMEFILIKCDDLLSKMVIYNESYFPQVNL